MPITRISIRQAKFFVWLLFFSFLVTAPVASQNYFFDSYSVKQGLSEQKVYTLLQDSRDNIWIGTANGLSRFDGKTFRNFTTRDSLAPGGVRSIMEDSQGNIWFGHLNGGISHFDGQKFEHAGFDSLSITGDITSIAQVRDKIWFTSFSDGALMATFPVADLRRIKAQQFTGKDNLSDQVVGSTKVNDTSLVCVANEGFLRRYNPDNNKFENYRMPHMTTYFSSTCLLEDSRGDLWFGTYNGGIYRYILSRSKMQVIDLVKDGMSSNWVTCITEDSKGHVWIGTWGGGAAMIEDSIPLIFDSRNGLKASNIYDIMEDVEGNILIADQSNGLTIYKGDAFITFNDKEILPDPVVNAIYQGKNGDLWFGTNAGISRYTPGADRKPAIFNKSTNSLYETVRFFREDKDGNLWIAANEGNAGGVIMYNMNSSRFEAQPYINASLPPRDSHITAMETDKNNNLWIGTVDGVVVGTVNQNNFTRYTVMDSLTVTWITALYNDPEGNMWIGTESRGGTPTLIKYTTSKKDFKAIDAFPRINPISMVMDAKGILWVGTNEGLKAFRDDSIIYSFTQDDGLLSNVINLLAAGKDGSIYIGTNNGLNRLLPESKRIFSYTERNGFPGIETRPNAVFSARNGDLWFGTAYGATRLTPEKTSVEELEPLTHILGMRVNYTSRDMISGMKLSFSERTVLFDYNSICVTNPDVVRYRVKLEGADKDWQPVTEQTRAIYSALPPGKYVFKVMASNSQGVWNREPATFSFFIIKPPFYRTWWFIMIVALVTVLAVVAYINIREKNLIREKIILEEKVKERTAEVVQKSMEIEEKNRDITASIRYAERIQRAMLPREDTFKETFVLFMPKDIVSGDFYWMSQQDDYQYIAACDCTGHGVPGAFMSIIGHNSLHKVVSEYGVTKPSDILDHLNTEVLKALMQRNEEPINDGMDMALIAFNKKNFTLEFAGAYNSLYVVRKGEVFVYKGDRFPIGMTAIGEKKSFSNQVVEIQKGDMLYMCSDGYADQFGSPEVKKYKSANIKKLLSEIYFLPVAEQRERLQKETIEWRGNLQQVDDILFIGTKIPEN